NADCFGPKPSPISAATRPCPAGRSVLPVVATCLSTTRSTFSGKVSCPATTSITTTYRKLWSGASSPVRKSTEDKDMNLLTHALPAALFTSLLCLSSLYYADDTEIYFARANADNEENRAVANVLIMLDTSGSMRFCQNELGGSGYNASWCSNAANRRINILQNALDQLLDSVSPGVRIGIGRYNCGAPNTNAGSGGTGQLDRRSLVAVTLLTPDTKSLIRSLLETLNGAGNNSSASAANAQP